jgi:hypothetical protein
VESLPVIVWIHGGAFTGVCIYLRKIAQPNMYSGRW